jgi:AcrR family transcriptional regulator
MRKLAEKIGCSHANLYLHFEDKEALFDCLVEESFEKFDAAMRAPESLRRGDPVEMVRKMGRAYVAFGLTNQRAYEFAFLMRRPGRDKAHASYERLRLLAQRCLDEKRFRPMDVEVASQVLWAAVHGITSLLILRPGFPWADKETLIGQVVDAAVNGLLA